MKGRVNCIIGDDDYSTTILWVEISIQDSGIGMSSELIKDLFRIDVNSGRRGTSGEVGTGLGLIICTESVEKNGGELNVESVEGMGSILRFTLPI